ncbi:MAG: radical SAM protein [Patescibacteria group bacterium]|nr:radical SAM protein [Patescibacteria group bacterium]
MKVLLLSIDPAKSRKCVNKDLAGGMGTGTWVGNSLRARLFGYLKKKSVILPDITIAYISAIFKQANYEVSMLKILEDKIPDIGPVDFVLISTSIVDCNHELDIIKKVKQRGYIVGVYGTFATAVPEFFSAHVDFLIKGEPEAGVLKIISDNSLPKGIVESGVVENLELLPFPDWSFFPINCFSYFPALNKKPVLTMLTSRGCQHRCSFYCPYTINAGCKYRARSLQNIVNEVEYLINDFGVKAIDFRDPIFTFNRARVVGFCNALINKKIKIIWSCETRIDNLDEELLKIMKMAGLKHINVGIESAVESVLNKSNRLPIKNEIQEKIIKFCQKSGISVAAFYILGMDNDTKESIEQTIDYAKKLNTLVAQFTINTPFPGTNFYLRIKKEGRINKCWEDFDSYSPVYKHQNLSAEELLFLKEKAFVSYYFRFAYIIKYFSKYLFSKLVCLF